MKKNLAFAVLLALCATALAATDKLVPAKRDMRANPPGKFLAPGYYVPNAFNAETVTVACSDGYRLSGDAIRRRRLPMNQMPAILFLHEAGKDRRSWYPLTIQMAGRNYISLAVDLRGCGENPKLNDPNGKSLDKLPDSDVRKMLDDVRNALSFLSMSPGVDPDRIGVIGSGLGASLALAAAAEPWGKNIQVVIALSPRLDDHGYKAAEAAKNLGKTLVCLAASRGDATAFQESSAIYAAAAGPKEFFDAEGNATGVGLFGARSAVPAKGDETNPVFFALIPQWFYQGLIKDSLPLPPARKPKKH